MQSDDDETEDGTDALAMERAFLREQIELAVLGGFDDEYDIEDWLEDETTDEDLLEELKAYAEELFRQEQAREDTWRTPTVNDAIDQAFEELNERGIVALQNAGFTMSDGWTDALEAASELPEKPRGAVFYHGQDLEYGVQGHGLMLAFGAFEDDETKSEAASAAIAREVCETLTAHGVEAKWESSVNSRIEIAPFPWRKRRWTDAP
jgi:hypothetical protein